MRRSQNVPTRHSVNRAPSAYSTSDRYSTNTSAMFISWWFCTYRRLANSGRDSSLQMATNRILASTREPPIWPSTA
jgi:hypothetical protein